MPAPLRSTLGSRRPSNRRAAHRAAWLLAALSALSSPSLALSEDLLYTPEPCGATDLRSASEDALLRCYAPRFQIEGSERTYNRIGTARAKPAWFGRTRVYVDPRQPRLYSELRRDRIAGRSVLQLIYRVHFEKIPLRFSRYFFEAHRNPGLLVVVTLDEATRSPWFVNTVHSCGCYMVLMPTDLVPRSWLPNDWPQHEQNRYGKQLPASLPSFDPRVAHLEFSLEPSSHRFRSARVVPPEADKASDAELREVLPIDAIDALRSLPIEGREESISFFYRAGPLRGHVRGAWNPFEGLTLFGMLSLDPTVGMDKDLGDPEETGTPFYTLLPFWMQSESRLDLYDPLLRTLGFRLPEG